MKRTASSIILILCILLLSCDEKKGEADILIEQLDSRSYKKREEATQKLEKMGAKVISKVQQCITDEESSLEQKQRCKLIVRKINKKRWEGIGPKEAKKLKEASLYTDFSQWEELLKNGQFFEGGYEGIKKHIKGIKDYLSDRNPALLKSELKWLKEFEKMTLGDGDKNGLPDEWEKTYGLTDPKGDPDRDGIKNKEEAEKGTNPYKKD